MKNIKYRVKLNNVFDEPYWQNDDLEKIVNHTSVDEYVTYNEGIFKAILDDFLDAPKKKLTADDIRKDFDDAHRPLSNGRIKVIAAYYNGRLALKKKIYAALKKIDVESIDKYSVVLLKFNIPFEMNYFSCEDNDPCDAATKQLESYIEIEISVEED